MLGTEGTRHISGMGSIVKASNKRSKKVEGGRENTRMTSAIRKEYCGEKQDEDKSSGAESCVCDCDLVPCAIVWGWTRRTCPALLREVSPCGYSDQARSGELYHICIGF